MSQINLEQLAHRSVLVAGAGRSGTSWLGKLLDASPSVLYRHEPDNPRFLPWFADVPSRIDPLPENERHAQPFARALEQCSARHCLHYVRPPDFPKPFLREAPWKLWNLALRGSRKLGVKRPPAFAIPQWMLRPDAPPPQLVWKSVMSTLRLAWIHAHFPELKSVLIMRHPGGYLGSWLRGAEKQGWVGFGSKQRLSQTILPFPLREHDKYADAYDKGSDFERELIYWIVSNETPLLQLGKDPRLHVVVYEDLCKHTERVVRGVYEHCDLPFDASTQRFIDESTSSHDEAYHSVFKNPAQVAEQWRSQLSGEQIEIVETYLADSALASYWPSAGGGAASS